MINYQISYKMMSHLEGVLLRVRGVLPVDVVLEVTDQFCILYNFYEVELTIS